MSKNDHFFEKERYYRLSDSEVRPIQDELRVFNFNDSFENKDRYDVQTVLESWTDDLESVHRTLIDLRDELTKHDIVDPTVRPTVLTLVPTFNSRKK